MCEEFYDTLSLMESFVYECVNCGHQICGDEGASLSCPKCRRSMKRIDLS